MKAVAEQDGRVLFAAGHHSFVDVRGSFNASRRVPLAHHKDVVVVGCSFEEVLLVYPLRVEDTVLAGRVVKVQSHGAVVAVCGGGEARERSALTRGRVADAEAAVREGEEEEAVGGGAAYFFKLPKELGLKGYIAFDTSLNLSHRLRI